MIYSLSNREERQKAIDRFKYLLEKGCEIELKEKRKKRTYSQNSYLHLILSAFAIEFGYRVDEVKLKIFKEYLNRELFYEKKVKLIGFESHSMRSTADLDTKELSLAIDRFKEYSAQNGLRLPEPEDIGFLQAIEKEIIKHSKYI